MEFYFDKGTYLLDKFNSINKQFSDKMTRYTIFLIDSQYDSHFTNVMVC